MNSELIATGLAVLVGLGVGTPILWKGLRTSDKPAIYLGLAISFEGLEWLLWGISLYTPLAGTSLGDLSALGCRIAILVMVAAMLLFTREVFRPGSRIATQGCWLAAFAMLAGFAGSAALGDWEGYRNDNVWIWLENGVQLAVFAWACAEPLGFYRKMRKRAEIGLGDPVVENRFLLWSIYGGGFTLSQLLWVGVLSFYEVQNALDVVIVAAGVVGEIAVWLAFFPPHWYLHWVDSREAVSAAS